MTGRVIVLDLSTGPERLTYHIECVEPAYRAGAEFAFLVEIADADDADLPYAADLCAHCGGPVGEPPVPEDTP